jgi:hypothetical protein
MPLVGRPRIRREMTAMARIRRRIQRLGPYPSLLLLSAPLAIVESTKLLALLVAGKGHWLSGTGMIVVAYAASLLIIERLFRIVKPKLLMLNWFATIWEMTTKVRSFIVSRLAIPAERSTVITNRVPLRRPIEMPCAKVSRD